ncbi:MAG: hypothetical protein ABI539_11330 [Acidobacteriota bacterium]
MYLKLLEAEKLLAKSFRLGMFDPVHSLSHPLLHNMQGFTSVPFKTESAHGLSQVNGVAKFSHAGLVLEFESKLFGIISNGVKEVRLPRDEILDIKFRKGLLKRSAKIEIRTKTMASLVELPNNEGKLILKIIRDDLERAQAAVSDLQKAMDEADASAPPPRTPVSQLFDDETEEETRLLDKK